MKFPTICILSSFASASAFTHQKTFGVSSGQKSVELSAQISRAEFLQTVTAASLLSVVAPQSANAAKYGGFGRGSAGVTDPKDKIVDDEILASESVQASLSKIKNYLSAVEGMQAAISSDTQSNIVPSIRKEFDFVDLRAALNTFNTAFDEETQRGTDRLIRIIIQDIDELEVNAKLKDGIPRSEKRLAVVTGKLSKLSKAFQDLLAFA